jgi:hypothetical protein
MSFDPIPLFNDNDVADTSRLNTMINNLNTLNENSITMRYSTPELVSTTRLKIATGRVDILPGKSSETVTVDLGDYFETTTAKPVINATIASQLRSRTYISISDVTSNSFKITVETSSGDPFASGNSVHWIAMGF